MKTDVHFLSYLAQPFLEWEMFQKKSCWEKENSHFTFNNFSFEKRSVYEIMWKNNVQPDRAQMTI